MFRQIVSIGVLGAFGVALVGCDSGGASLAGAKGKVLYNGQPVAAATVTFMPAEGALATGTTDSNGEFTLSTGGQPGAVVGEHNVSVVKAAASETAGATGEMTPDDMRKMGMEQTEGGSAPAAPKSEIPSKYANPETSGLTATVSSDASKNEFEFPLVD